MLASFFIARGRTGRMAFWRGTAIIGIGFQLVGLAFILLATGMTWPPIVQTFGLLLLLAVTAWVATVVGIRRLHDRDRSGWWMLFAAVPIVGTVWHLVANGCLLGTAGPNRYGVATAGMPAVGDVFGDDGIPAASRGRRASLVGTIVLWLTLLVVTAITLLLFQDPNQRSEAQRQHASFAPSLTSARPTTKAFPSG